MTWAAAQCGGCVRTYWGPLIFTVIKNFEGSAADNRLVFRTVVATPKPRVIDMEIVRQEQSSIRRPGGTIDAVRSHCSRPSTG